MSDKKAQGQAHACMLGVRVQQRMRLALVIVMPRHACLLTKGLMRHGLTVEVAADGNAEALVLEDVGDAETVSARTQDSALPPHPQTHHAAVAEAQAQQASTRSPTKPPAAGKGEALANVNADNGFRNGDAKGQVYPTTPGQPSPPSVAQIVIPPALTPAPPPLPPED